MPHRLRGIGPVLAAILLVAMPGPLSGQAITRLDVGGNRKVAAERVRSASLLRVGDPFSLLTVQRALKSLYATHLFTDIQIVGSETAEGIALTIQVTEAPVIDQVEYRGNRHIKAEKLRDAAATPSGSLLNPSSLQESRNKILGLYREEGYALASVRPAQEPAPGEGRVRLVWQIDEGRKVRVQAMQFRGNSAFPAERLRGALKTEQDGFWPWQGSTFKEGVLEEDVHTRLPEWYRRRGFLDMTVERQTVEFDSARGRASVTVAVDEGPRYRVGQVAFDGNRRFSAEQLRPLVPLEEGAIYDQERYDRALRALYEAYGNEGYIYAQVTPELTRQGETVDLLLRIREGEPAHVRKVIIEGNEITREKVVRREMAILPGDLFKQSLLVRSYQQAMNTGYFENIDIDQRRVPDSAGDIDLFLRVHEKRTGQASTGAGFGAGGGLTGFVELAQTNLFGKGQKASLRVEFGRRQNNVEASFTEPYFRDTPTSVGFDLFRLDQSFINDPFNRRTAGGAFRLGVPLPRADYTRLFTTYRLERFSLRPRAGVTSIDADSLAQIFGGKFPRTLSSISFTVARDTRDNIFHPTQGTRHSATLEFAGGLLGGSTDFQKYRLETAWSVPTIERSAFTLRMKAGVVTGYGDPSTVPINERFVLGGIGPGIEGLRGYRDRSVGPAETFRRGRAFLLLTAEHEVRITNQVFGVLFFDAGDNWASLSEADPMHLKRGLGFGIRVEVPGLGPLGLDLGYGLDRPEGPGWEPHVTFGSFFR